MRADENEKERVCTKTSTDVEDEYRQHNARFRPLYISLGISLVSVICWGSVPYTQILSPKMGEGQVRVINRKLSSKVLNRCHIHARHMFPNDPAVRSP